MRKTSRPYLALLIGVVIAPNVFAQNCCTHQDGSVACPSGLPAGSRSLQFVQGGTIWQTPSGSTVFVPASTFNACSQTPTTTTPPPPAANPPRTTPPPQQTPSQPPAQTTPQTPSPGTADKPSSPRPWPKLDPYLPETPAQPLPQFPQNVPTNPTQPNSPADQTMPPVPLGPSTAGDDKKTSEAIQRLAAARKCECPCDCYDIVNKLPAGYKIAKGKEMGFHADWSGLTPGLPLGWNETVCAWMPPEFHPDPSDPERLFNQATGQNAVWDDKKQQWIDTKTGKSLGYDQ